MTKFTLDTSGAVEIDGEPMKGMATYCFWENLSPFAQGYVEAMFASLRGRFQPGKSREAISKYGFSDLHPETLAAILKTCEELTAGGPEETEEGGRHAWAVQQVGRWRPSHPPIVPYLSDDGKVRFREAGE